MAVKNFNLSGVSSDIQLGKRGGRMVFDDADTAFKFFESDGTTSANLEAQDLTVNGNLTVLGDTTTINVATLEVEDNLIEINSGETGAGVSSSTAGIDINRGTELNVQMIWDESDDVIRFQYSDGTLLSVEGDMPVQTSESLYRESDGKIILDGSGATSASAEYLDLSTDSDVVTLTSRNEAGSGDVDLVLTTQGNGSVVIASSDGTANGFIGAIDGTDLSLSGGDEGTTEETGDLLLSGGDGDTVTGGDVVLSGGANGGTVRIDTTVTTINDTSSDDTVSTVRYVKDKVAEIDTDFIASGDTPESYGTAGQYVVINGTADGLEFIDLPEFSTTFLELEDTPVDFGTEGQVAAVNAAGDALEFITIDTSFIGGDDTPESYGTSGQIVVINGTGDGLEFVDNNTTFIDGDDTPSTYGDAGQFVAINSTADGLEFVDIDTTFIGGSDTPETYGTAGQYVVINGAGDGLEFADFPTISFSELDETPEALGTTGQMLVVNSAGDALEFVDQPTIPETTLDLSDTPSTYGTEGQVLAVNAAGDGHEYIDVQTDTLDAVQLADMYSSIASYDATSGTYAVVAIPQEYTTSNEVTDRIVVTRMTIKVSSDLDAGTGFKVIVQNDSAQTEAAVIDDGSNSDVLSGVYVIDGIFQNVTYDTLQNVSIALVDTNGDPIAATSGTVDVLTEYKTVFV